MNTLGSGTAVLRSAPTAVMHNDVEYNFRQDSDFFYLTGLDEADAVAVLAPHHEHQFVLFVQPRDPEQETWHGYRTGVEAAKAQYGADEAYPITELDQHLPQYLEQADRIYTHLGRDRDFNQTLLGHWQKLLRTFSKRGTGPMGIEEIGFKLHALRMVKSDAELTLMRKAIAISVEAHNAARQMAQPGRYEHEIQAELEYIFRKQGAQGPAYPSIVASGANACVLHYTSNSSQLQAGDLLLIDAGASYGYYNADITRTFPVGGQMRPEQQALYDLVLRSQQAAIAEIYPGQPYNAFHDAAVQVLTAGLVELGLLVGEIDQLIESEAYKPFYMHRTGHWLGLDVHDAGFYKVGKDDWQTLSIGNIVTVEPGLYIGPDIKLAEDQPEVPAQWRGIGIRIEDDVLVTAAGNEVLTAAVPK